MPKPRGLEAKLARLKALRHEPQSADHVAELRTALADKSNLVVAEAADIAGERLLKELEPDLVTAFHRFMIDAEETDKLCAAKLAIVETLNKLESANEDLLLTAIHHVQMEPRWGKPEDTAASLRGTAAFGLVRLGYRNIVMLLVELLNDSEKVARSAAATALGALGTPPCIPLLRFKALDESLEFVAKFLDSPRESVQESAAFALAESRRPDAFELLKQHWLKHRMMVS
jgi:HEAT repeat protein